MATLWKPSFSVDVALEWHRRMMAQMLRHAVVANVLGKAAAAYEKGGDEVYLAALALLAHLTVLGPCARLLLRRRRRLLRARLALARVQRVGVRGAEVGDKVGGGQLAVAHDLGVLVAGPAAIHAQQALASGGDVVAAGGVRHEARQVPEDAARRRLHAQKGIADSGAARQRPTASSAFISRGEVVGGVGELGGVTNSRIVRINDPRREARIGNSEWSVYMAIRLPGIRE